MKSWLLSALALAWLAGCAGPGHAPLPHNHHKVLGDDARHRHHPDPFRQPSDSTPVEKERR